MDLTGVYTFYDMKHELGRGTFTTVMKVMSCTTGEWWAIKIIDTQKLSLVLLSLFLPPLLSLLLSLLPLFDARSAHFASLAREASILEELNHPNICRLRLRETFVPDAGGNDFC